MRTLSNQNFGKFYIDGVKSPQWLHQGLNEQRTVGLPWMNPLAFDGTHRFKHDRDEERPAKIA